MTKKLAIVAAWVGEAPDIISDVRRNHEKFAHRHGYDYHFYGENEIHSLQELVKGPGDLHWIKPEVISSALESYDFVFWTDLDSVFHTIDQSLEDLILPGKDFVFTGDHNDLFNGGHLFFRKSEFTQNLINQWSRLQTIPFPLWAEGAQQGISGHVGDQVAMNFLLAGGRAEKSDVEQNALQLLNRTNGWLGNPQRERKRFHRTHAPNSVPNLRRARRLLDPVLRESVEIVVQHRLNAYPWWGPKGRGNHLGPIIHFVPPYKELLPNYFNVGPAI